MPFNIVICHRFRGSGSLRLGPLDLAHELSRPIGSEVVAQGEVVGPEDLAYDKRRRVIYTGCEDGWIKRITVNDSVADTVVENWVNTGGRPLGLALEKSGELMVADAIKVGPFQLRD
ncbi:STRICTOSIDINE SYNTHASE 4 [Spatholobus suberectus]|nr:STRICTOSIDINE SYNTHASE 4 [Spatholobus suberectus]